MAAAIYGLQRLFHGLVGRDLTSKNHKKEEPQTSYSYTTQCGARTQTDTPWKGHMMHHGLLPVIQTQALGWRRHQVHLCASKDVTLTIL